MSSIPKEHDYIGLSEAPSMEKIFDKLSSSSSTLSKEENINSNSSNTSLNLKETELRLGLPGFQSPERKLTLPAAGVSLFGKDIDTSSPNGYRPLKNLVSGVKRGFSDTIVGSSGKWVFSGSNGSEVDLGKGAILFSPRGDNGNSQKSCVAGPAKKDDVAQSPKPVQEKNSQVAAANENSSAPAAK